MKKVKKLIRRFSRIEKIDTFVYYKTKDQSFQVDNSFPVAGTEIREQTPGRGKRSFHTFSDGKLSHISNIFEKAHVLTLINGKGPVIGDCFTVEEYRGKSLYPYTIDKLCQMLFSEGHEIVYILVAPDNIASIKGIEKAGFIKKCRIITNRYLLFYFNVKIIGSLRS